MESIGCQQPCPAIREESMGPNTYYQRRSRPKRPRPPTGTTHASLPPDRSVSAPHMYQRTVPEQKHMATGIMNTSESDDAIHRGQTLHVELGRHRTRRSLESQSPIFSTPNPLLLKSPEKAVLEGSAVPFERDMIVLFLVTWYHACDDSVGSVENATIGLLIRTDDLSWIVSLTHYRTTRRIPTTGTCYNPAQRTPAAST